MDGSNIADPYGKDVVTVLTTEPHKRASKVIRVPEIPVEKELIAASGDRAIIDGYNAGMWFHVTEYPVSDMMDLSQLLAMLAGAPRCLVIRGRARPGTNLTHTRRRKEHFAPTPHQWIAVDLDKLPCPADIDPVTAPEKAVKYLVLEWLPKSLHKGACFWQFTSSQGIRKPGTLSARMWFWSEEPRTDAELKRWALTWNTKKGEKVIDPALYHEIQPHYTASPTFLNYDDPLPARIGEARSGYRLHRCSGGDSALAVLS